MGSNSSKYCSQVQIADFHAAITEGDYQLTADIINNAKIETEKERLRRGVDPKLSMTKELMSRPQDLQVKGQTTTYAAYGRAALLIALDSSQNAKRKQPQSGPAASLSLPSNTFVESTLSNADAIIALLLENGGTDIEGEDKLWRSVVAELRSNPFFISGC